MDEYLETLNIDYSNGVIDLNCDPITINGIVYETPFQISSKIESGILLSRSFDMYEIIDVIPDTYPYKDEI